MKKLVRNKTFSGILILLMLLAASLLIMVPHASAQTETVLYNFTESTGTEPVAGVIFDKAGNLYGTTYAGGSDKAGTVYELSPNTGGGWTQKVLYDFNMRGGGGFYPYGNVIFDSAGNLYGTTGTTYNLDAFGAVYKLTPKGNGSWVETALHEFRKFPDGIYPSSGLALDAAGNLYGTAVDGGHFNAGIAYKLTPRPQGKWTETIMHSFNARATDGQNPYGSLTFDAAGNLYGTTIRGGNFGEGTVFQLSPKSAGGWLERSLYSFGNGSNDGQAPFSNMIFDAHGNLYGTTVAGGAYGKGTVFELSPAADGNWKETLLYSFKNDVTDGQSPYGGVTFDAAGNLYGTTAYGGTYSAGTVFELFPTVGGSWTETVLHTFTSQTDGGIPEAGVILDADGNLFGTTEYGGSNGVGTVFEITR